MEIQKQLVGRQRGFAAGIKYASKKSVLTLPVRNSRHEEELGLGSLGLGPWGKQKIAKVLGQYLGVKQEG